MVSETRVAGPGESADLGRWIAVTVLALGSFAAATDNFLVAGVLPALSGDLGVSISAAGQLVTAYSVAYALGAPIVMVLARGRSPRRLLLVAMVAFVVVNIVAALAHDGLTMAAARVVAGCLGGVYSPLAAAVAAGSLPARLRGRALALVIGGASMATLAGVPLGVWISGWSSWRWAFAGVAVVAATAAVGVALSAPRSAAVTAVSVRRRIGLLCRAGILHPLAVTVTFQAAGFLVYTYVQPLFAARPAVGAGAVGFLIMIQGVGALSGLLLGGWLVDRLGARSVLLASLVIEALDMASLSVGARTVAGAAVFAAVWGASGWAMVPALQHRLLGACPPELSAAVLSLNGSATYVGVAVGSATGGVVLAALGVDRLWVFATAFAAAALLLGVLLGRPRPAGPPQYADELSGNGGRRETVADVGE